MHRLVLTSYGRPARAALESLVAEAKGADPLAPVTVAVPSNYAGLSLRRHDARFGPNHAPGLVNVRFLALNRVAELLGAPFLAEPDRRPAHSRSAARGGAGRARRRRPACFASVAGHPSTVRALVSAFADLRVADDAALARLAETSPRAASVVRCYHRFRELTAGTYDDEDQLEVAAALVAESGVPADLGALVLFLPDRLSPGGLALVAGFASRTFTAAVLGLTGDPDADAETRALGETLGRGRSGDPLDSGPATVRVGDRVISAPDPESEVREVVRALVERADAGRSLHDVAVAWRIAEPHAGLLHERLGRSRHPRLRTLGAAALGHGHRPQPRRADGPRRPRLPPRRRHGSPRRRVDPRDRRRSVGARWTAGTGCPGRRESSRAPTSGRPGSRAGAQEILDRAAGTRPGVARRRAREDRPVRRSSSRSSWRGPPRRSRRGPTGSHGHVARAALHRHAAADLARGRDRRPRAGARTARGTRRALEHDPGRSADLPGRARPSSSSSPSTTSAASGSACCSPRSDRCAAPTSTPCSSSAPLRAGCPRHRATTRCSPIASGPSPRARFRPVRSPPAASARSTSRRSAARAGRCSSAGRVRIPSASAPCSRRAGSSRRCASSPAR